MKRTIFFTAAFLSLLGLMESRAQNMQNNRNMEKLKLTEEWDKTFPKSDKVDHSKVTFVNRFGITLAADLYVPKIAVADKFPAIAVSGPFGAVKEQSSGLYAQTLAERGFLTIAFDPSFTGESSGQPRSVASPDINTEDFSAAVDYLATRPDVDAERIGILAHQGYGGFYHVRYQPRQCQRLFRCSGQCRCTLPDASGAQCATHKRLSYGYLPLHDNES